METSDELSASGRVVLDANGQGVVILMPSNANERWVINSTSVRQQTAVTKYPQFFSYVGNITPNQSVDSTYSGNQADSDSVISIPYGSYFTGQWINGDVGAIMTVSVRGVRFQKR